jgi:oxygen-independent coproporphyrinogen-3 oxidase
MQTGSTLSLYIHIPFCYDKCAYCDFYSLPHYGRPDEALLSVERERIGARGRSWLEKLAPRKIESIYIGGGTPSSVGLKELEAFLSLIRRLLEECGLSFDGEFTIEANPRNISQSLLTLLSGLGVNRISLGVQSIDAEDLGYLGRSSSPELIRRALAFIRNAWQGRLSVDIMAGIPGQRLETIRKLISEAESAGADHLSIYQLTLEEGTPLASSVARGLRAAPGEREYLELFKGAAAAAEEAGYKRYEVSAFAKPGGVSRHNLRYWHLQPYLGLGSGAVSTIPDGEGGVIRLTQTPDGTETREIIGERDLFIEGLITGFRLVEGIDGNLSFAGSTLKDMAPRTLSRYRSSGLLASGEGKVRLTDGGLDILDTFLVDLLSELP